ncbi:MAG: GntR family transcriptional regulator [Usitatibacter sp.]
MQMQKKRETLGARHSPLNKLVADAIRERILSGEFAQGERLAEEKLSAELGVSRMPVREALRALAAEGIVTVEPRRGASVTSYTAAQIQELVEVRATLEALNAKLAAKRHDPGQIAELERILAAGSKITEKSDLAQIQENNARFHEAVAAIAANSVLIHIVRSLRDRTALIFAPISRTRIRQNWREHAAIVRAVIEGDAELAGDLAARHVYSAAQMAEPAGREAAAPKARARRAA